MSAYDFELYRRFCRVYGPIGERRQDYRMAILTASQCAKTGDTVEKFLPKFESRVVGVEDDEPETIEHLQTKAVRIVSEIVKSHRGTVKQGPLRTLEFKPGQLRRIKHHGKNGSEPGG